MFLYGLSLIISFVYHGHMSKCFLDLSWMYAVVFLDLSCMFALVFPSSIMNVCHTVSLIYDECVPQCFLDS